MVLFSRRAVVASGLPFFFFGSCGGDGDHGPGPGPTPSPSPTPTPTPTPPRTVEFDFSFADGRGDWEPDYADYSLGQEASIGFASGHGRLPAPLDDRFGLFLSANNRSDDLFMYLTRRVGGLVPGQRYRVELEIRFATNAPPGCPGAGGSPGDSVFLKAGATGARPDKLLDGQRVIVNFDKGNQATGGANAAVIGTFAQEEAAGGCTDAPYALKTLSTGGEGPVVASSWDGRLWLVIGTDSGFEGFTRAYYLEGTARLVPV